MGTHDGHRERLKGRFRSSGLDDFEEINVLELILFFSIPRRDTNELAHRLLKRFGSLRGVLEASPAELQSVEGIGETSADLLHLFPEVNRRYLRSGRQQGAVIDSPELAGEYFIPYFLYRTDEIAYALLSDARRREIKCIEIGRGVVNGTELNTRRLLEEVIACKASYVILAHNHPGGEPDPSPEDESSSEQIAAALRMIGVELTDHIVVAGKKYVSMRENGMLR